MPDTPFKGPNKPQSHICELHISFMDRHRKISFCSLYWHFSPLKQVFFILLFSSLCFICPILALACPALCILESFIKMKINLNFYFHASLWCLKKFYEGF